MSESQSWRRGFGAGLLALALSIAGQVAVRASDERGASSSCPLSRRASFSRYSQRPVPWADDRGIAQRVALAVIGAVLHGCS